METINVKRFHKGALLPTRAHPDDAGMDLYALDSIFVPLHGTVVVRTGLGFDIPKGTFIKLEDRSSMAKRGIRVRGGIIDAGYVGECSVVLHNESNDSYTDPNAPYPIKGFLIAKGERIAQALVMPVLTPTVVEVEELASSDRGTDGFGSSGA